MHGLGRHSPEASVPSSGNWSPGCTQRSAGSRLPPLADYEQPLEQRLPLGVSISCVVILAICLSCYFSIIK